MSQYIHVGKHGMPRDSRHSVVVQSRYLEANSSRKEEVDEGDWTIHPFWVKWKPGLSYAFKVNYLL